MLIVSFIAIIVAPEDLQIIMNNAMLLLSSMQPEYLTLFALSI